MGNELPTPRKLRYSCAAQRAARQWGNVTAQQLARCGVGSTTIDRWVADGRLHRRHRGVYAVGHRHPAPEARWAAALLAYGPDAVLSRYVSVALHGLGRPPGVVTVALPNRRARKQTGVEPHCTIPFERGEVVIVKGLRTTAVERTLLDLAAIGEPIDRLVAEAVAKRLTSTARLRAYLERRSGARGARALRECIQGGQMRSRAEKEFARWLEQRDIQRPAFNEPFGPYTLDAVWPHARLVVEIDTYETHGTRHSFEADRRRDAYTAARGLRTIRVTPSRWRQDGDRLERDLRRALAHR
jgi:very-short-patch-repair endonuclease